jgi:hypothetical protein
MPCVRSFGSKEIARLSLERSSCDQHHACYLLPIADADYRKSCPSVYQVVDCGTRGIVTHEALASVYPARWLKALLIARPNSSASTIERRDGSRVPLAD